MFRKPNNVIKLAKPKYGLGDAVAAVAQPVAKAIDRVVRTNLANCSGCNQRKADLNEAMPDILHPFSK